MFNISKGNGLTLQQVDTVGSVVTNPTGAGYQVIKAGAVVNVVDDGSGRTVTLGGAADALLGFAINNNTDSDVLATGKLGVYLLNGGDVVGTDQVTGAITAANFPAGTKVTYDGATGNVKAAGASDPVLGTVVGLDTVFPDGNFYTNTTLLNIKLGA